MTPKEKAKELLDIYLNITKREFVDDGFYYDMDLAKELALIAAIDMAQVTGAKYWYNVKQEIQKL